MEGLEDEIEYFGFLPVGFTSELQEELEILFIELMDTYDIKNNKVRVYIIESLRKNMFIFGNFILRNILRFPNGFRLERKITDKTIKDDEEKMLKKLEEKYSKFKELRGKENILVEKLEDEKIIISGYRELLKNQERYKNLILAARDIKMFLKETSTLYDEFRYMNSEKEKEFEDLMEYKSIRNEYYGNVLEDLKKSAKIEDIEYYNTRFQ